ncbi:MAG: AsnC family transcriptional regulator [Dethiobacter sp.]|jgi:DNA-binding Lrp family transcriptional regulator|nr:AsnC family transcriptional regulator [Dethiobacter sp.]
MKQKTAVDSLSGVDRELLNIIQTDFPLEPRPYAVIGERLGLSEKDTLSRVAALKEKGVIRRIGGIFDSGKLGFSSTLVALKVEEDRVEEVARSVGSYAGVTHNYQRAHEFNLWYTLVAPSVGAMEQILAETSCLPGVLKLRNLPALRLFKIGVNFDMQEND